MGVWPTSSVMFSAIPDLFTVNVLFIANSQDYGSPAARSNLTN
jgi:hypothetical protein